MKTQITSRKLTDKVITPSLMSQVEGLDRSLLTPERGVSSGLVPAQLPHRWSLAQRPRSSDMGQDRWCQVGLPGAHLSQGRVSAVC